MGVLDFRLRFVLVLIEAVEVVLEGDGLYLLLMLFQLMDDLVVDAAFVVVAGELVLVLVLFYECQQVRLLLLLLHELLHLAKQLLLLFLQLSPVLFQLFLLLLQLPLVQELNLLFLHLHLLGLRDVGLQLRELLLLLLLGSFPAFLAVVGQKLNGLPDLCPFFRDDLLALIADAFGH